MVRVRATFANGQTSTQMISVAMADVLEPALTVSKTVRVVAEAGSSADCATSPQLLGAEAALPGACLEYTITVTSAANGAPAASNVRIVDNLPSNTLLVAANQNSGFSSVTAGAGAVTGVIASLPAGSSAIFKIRALVR